MLNGFVDDDVVVDCHLQTAISTKCTAGYFRPLGVWDIGSMDGGMDGSSPDAPSGIIVPDGVIVLMVYIGLLDILL